MKFIFTLFPLLLIVTFLFSGESRGQATSAPFVLPAGNFVSPDGKTFLAIRPGNRLYLRNDGEDRFSLFLTKVSASVRNEYWLERVENLTGEGVSGPVQPDQAPVAEGIAAPAKAGTPTGASVPGISPPPATKGGPEASFSDSDRLVLIFGPLELEILLFDDGELLGSQKFRRIRQSLPVPDHREG